MADLLKSLIHHIEQAQRGVRWHPEHTAEMQADVEALERRIAALEKSLAALWVKSDERLDKLEEIADWHQDGR